VIFGAERKRKAEKTVTLQDLINSEHGLWAVAPYFRSWMHGFAKTAAADLREELDFIRGELDSVLTDDQTEAARSMSLRAVVDQAFFQVQLLVPEVGELSAFRRWLAESGDMMARTHCALARIDAVLDDFFASPTPEIQELRSLRKGVLANWAMLNELQRLADSGSPEDRAALGGVEESLQMMLERSESLLRTYDSL
jgi:hypothetical protein